MFSFFYGVFILLLVEGEGDAIEGADALLLEVKEEVIILVPEVVDVVVVDAGHAEGLEARVLVLGQGRNLLLLVLVSVSAGEILKGLLNLMLLDVHSAAVDEGPALLDDAIPLTGQSGLKHVLGRVVLALRRVKVLLDPLVEGDDHVLDDAKVDGRVHFDDDSSDGAGACILGNIGRSAIQIFLAGQVRKLNN